MDKSITPQKPRLLDQVRERLHYQHYSLSTENVYGYWIRFFIRRSGVRHPAEMIAHRILGGVLAAVTTWKKCPHLNTCLPRGSQGTCQSVAQYQGQQAYPPP
jgi:hypothetical protein